MEQLHSKVNNKLDYFINNKKIPHIIFHGPSGSGKKTIVKNFINKIYNYDNNTMKNFVLFVNCSHGKGIKFIRDELKFFSKTNILNNSNNINFKSIVLLNADFLTIDAQSALRRCIELFSHSTRFFIIVENKFKLLKPILSRFCEIFIQDNSNNKLCNLNALHIKNNSIFSIKYDNLKKIINTNISTYNQLFAISNKIYLKGYSSLDIVYLINNNLIDSLHNEEHLRNIIIFCFNKIKYDFRNENLLIIFILNFIYFRSHLDLENISFI